MRIKIILIIFLCCLGISSTYFQTTFVLESICLKMYNGFPDYRNNAPKRTLILNFE